MMWYILGAVLAIVLIIQDLMDYGYFKIDRAFGAIVACAILASLGNVICSGILYAISPEPYNDPGVEESYSSAYDILPFTQDEYVKFTSSRRNTYIMLLLDNGEVHQYNINIIETQIRVALDGEQPTVKRVRYSGYADWRKWLTTFSVSSTWTFITLPPGISQPIT